MQNELIDAAPRKWLATFFSLAVLVYLPYLLAYTFVPHQPEQPKAETTRAVIAQPQTHLVTAVVDGDTIKVDIDGTIEAIRLIGIDTPETVDPRKPVQCFGKEASARTKELLLGKRVTLEADESQSERDKYERLLRYVIMEDGRNFNLLMIEEGYAHEYTYDSNPYRYQSQFREAQIRAQKIRIGMWEPTTCP